MGVQTLLKLLDWYWLIGDSELPHSLRETVFEQLVNSRDRIGGMFNGLREQLMCFHGIEP